MSKKKLCVPANKEAIDINVVRPEDFETAADYDEYLSANWPAVIIHNLFVQASLLKKLNENIEQLDCYCNRWTEEDYEEEMEKPKFYGH